MEKKILTILLVDDDMDILKVLKKLMEAKGFKVLAVPTGTAAIAMVGNEQLDAVLLDIRLPDISGLDVLKEIKSKFPKLPVVMLTGFGYDDRLVNESLLLGASGYVSKSMPVNEAIEEINNILTK